MNVNQFKRLEFFYKENLLLNKVSTICPLCKKLYYLHCTLKHRSNSKLLQSVLNIDHNCWIGKNEIHCHIEKYQEFSDLDIEYSYKLSYSFYISNYPYTIYYMDNLEDNKKILEISLENYNKQLLVKKLPLKNGIAHIYSKNKINKLIDIIDKFELIS